MENKPQFFIIRGLPGSGKSTIAKMLLDHEDYSVHLEADMYFTDVYGNYNFDINQISDAHEWCQDETMEAIRIYESAGVGNNGIIVVSNTFTTKKELRPYFEIAKEFNVRPQVITCQGSFGSIHNVPEETLKRMKERFDFKCVDELFKEYFDDGV